MQKKTKQEAEADLSYITVAGAAVCVTALDMHNFFPLNYSDDLEKAKGRGLWNGICCC